MKALEIDGCAARDFFAQCRSGTRKRDYVGVQTITIHLPF